MNQKICVAVLFVSVCLCLTSAVPTIGGISLGLGPRGFGGIGVNPYSGAYGGVGSVDPIYSNGFGSEYGSRYSAYNGYGGFGGSSPYYNRFGGGYGGFGGGIAPGYGGGFQY